MDKEVRLGQNSLIKAKKEFDYRNLITGFFFIHLSFCLSPTRRNDIILSVETNRCFEGAMLFPMEKRAKSGHVGGVEESHEYFELLLINQKRKFYRRISVFEGGQYTEGLPLFLSTNLF